MRLKNVVSQEWLMEHLDQSQLVIADCRFLLGDSQKGYEDYQAGHIPGAIYLDLEKDLSAPKQQHGGRHPLPKIDDLAAKLGSSGIDSTKTVVAYDDQGGVMAARLWWLLKYAGHEQVFILNKGYSSWKDHGYPVTTEILENEPKNFIPRVKQELLVTMEEVRSKLDDENTILIDSRSKERYLGLQEEVDPVAGHIPGAILEFWKESLQDGGSWKDVDQQKSRFSNYLQQVDKELIVYCGSGVTACANMIAFEEAGLKPRLYLGSWSDWISYPENKIEKET